MYSTEAKALRREDLGDLMNLLALAQEGNFTRAAATARKPG